MPGSDEPVYSQGDRQIVRILHRAAELQERDTERASPDPATELSLTELKQIAGEVGIDPRYVEAAAAELQAGDEGRRRFLFWGAPLSSTLERSVQGEVSNEEWEALITKIRDATSWVGKPSTLGRSLEWVSQRDHISVSPREGRTRIRILSRYVDLMVMAYLPSLYGTVLLDTLIAAGLHGAPLEAVGLGAVVTGACFGLARRWAGAMVRNHRGKMQALLQELADHVAQTALPASPERLLSKRSAGARDSAPAGEALNVSQQTGT